MKRRMESGRKWHWCAGTWGVSSLKTRRRLLPLQLLLLPRRPPPHPRRHPPLPGEVRRRPERDFCQRWRISWAGRCRMATRRALVRRRRRCSGGVPCRYPSRKRCIVAPFYAPSSFTPPPEDKRPQHQYQPSRLRPLRPLPPLPRPRRACTAPFPRPRSSRACRSEPCSTPTVRRRQRPFPTQKMTLPRPFLVASGPGCAFHSRRHRHL